MAGINTSIPFSFFASLCRELSEIKPRPVRRGTTVPYSPDSEAPSIKVFRRWVQELRRRFPGPPPGIGALLFLFLFPEEDVARKYGLQEISLAKMLGSIFGISMIDDDRGAGFDAWASPSNEASCLGHRLGRLLSRSPTIVSMEGDIQDKLSLQEVNLMLNELAARSAYSSSSLRDSGFNSCRTRQQILQDLYRRLQPFDAAVLTQVILKDLRPILYPIEDISIASSLLDFNSNAMHVLTLQDAMRIWDTSGVLLRCYALRCTIEHSFELFEREPATSITLQVGVPIQIPKCVKGQGCKDALKKLRTSTSTWAETKYDGERTQIHVAVNGNGDSKITIFSKSKRDSTMDRIATHWIIREALGLQHDRSQDVRARAQRNAFRQSSLSSVILEAEMVAYEDDIGIGEFWQIRELIESTASGARRRRKDTRMTSSESSRHLALVFFDILYLNGTSLLSESYCSRRASLEAVIRPISGYAFLACRAKIPLSGGRRYSQGLKELERIFTASVANREEGLVLKAAEASYADWHLPWIKLKKDYIPGLGDAVDLILVGASWDKERGRILRVPPSTYTAFYVGASHSRTRLENSRPHLEILFAVSYGLDRKQLEELNFLIRSMDPLPYRKDLQSELPFVFGLSRGLSQPSIILKKPLLVEVYGAGFTKTDASKHYELRFPRISKVYRANDRSWIEGVTLTEFDNMAYNTVRKDGKTANEANDCVLESQARLLPGIAYSRKRDDVLATQVDSSCGGRKRRRISENDCLGPIGGPVKCFPPMLSTRETSGNVEDPLRSLTNRESLRGGSLPRGEASIVADIEPTRDLNGVNDRFLPRADRVSVDTTNWSGSGKEALAAFLERGVILLDCNFRSQDFDSGFIDRFVIPYIVHSREAFALGCGWGCDAEQTTLSAVDYGIVFADDGNIQEWCETPPFANCSARLEGRRKPILVFNSDCLRSGVLEGVIPKDQLDIATICMAAYL